MQRHPQPPLHHQQRPEQAEDGTGRAHGVADLPDLVEVRREQLERHRPAERAQQVQPHEPGPAEDVLEVRPHQEQGVHVEQDVGDAVGAAGGVQERRGEEPPGLLAGERRANANRPVTSRPGTYCSRLTSTHSPIRT